MGAIEKRRIQWYDATKDIRVVQDKASTTPTQRWVKMHEGHSCRDHDLPASHIFATLFAMPSLEWNNPKVAQPGLELYWDFSLLTTAIVLSVWHTMSSERTVFAKAWKLIKVNSEQTRQKQEHKNPSTKWVPFRLDLP